MRRTAEERAGFVESMSRYMAGNPTPAEAALSEILHPLGFKFQVTMGGQTKNGGFWNYILDAYHLELKLCVEVDGGVHARTRGRDRRRDARLAGEGIRTIRFSNKTVLKAPESVQHTIYDQMTMRELGNEPS